MSEAPHKDNIKKLYLIVGLRFLLIFCCVIAITIQSGNWNFPRSVGLLLEVDFGLNCLFLALVLFLYKNFAAFVLFQIFTDFLAQTILIYLTGGIFSVFTSLHFVTIILSGILISPGSSLICASVATIGISGIALLYFLAAIDNIALPFLEQENIYYFLIAADLSFCKAYLFAQGVAFYLVAFLSSRLAVTISRGRVLQEEILENLKDGVLVVDAKQNLLFINSSAKKILGLPASDAADGVSITQFFDPIRHRDILKVAKMQTSCAFESAVSFEGRTTPIHLTASTIGTSDKVRAVIVIVRDISHQIRMEEAIEQAGKLKALSEVATMITHEIRNPLASIRGAVQELRDFIPQDASPHLLINITLRESDRVNRIITDFMEFSKMRPPVFQSCDVDRLLGEVVFLLNKRRDMDGRKVVADIQEPLVIHADPEQLKQLFFNLGINAIEASPEKAEISVHACRKRAEDFSEERRGKKTGDGIEVVFCDSGKGMTPEELARIFTPFFSTKTQGTGMGLAFVSRVLEFHMGMHRVESEPDRGTKFHLWLPQSPDS